VHLIILNFKSENGIQNTVSVASRTYAWEWIVSPQGPKGPPPNSQAYFYGSSMGHVYKRVELDWIGLLKGWAVRLYTWPESVEGSLEEGWPEDSGFCSLRLPRRVFSRTRGAGWPGGSSGAERRWQRRCGLRSRWQRHRLRATAAAIPWIRCHNPSSSTQQASATKPAEVFAPTSSKKKPPPRPLVHAVHEPVDQY